MAAGATVIATSSTDEKLALSKRLGAHHTINYRQIPDWGDEVLKITDGKGVDFVLDVGGAGTIENSLKSVRTGGLVSIAGILTPPKEIDVVPAILYGAKTGNYFDADGTTGPELMSADFKNFVVRGQLACSKTMNEDLVRRVEADKIHPVIAKTFEWSEAKEAFALLMNQSEAGKIVIKGVPAGSL